MGFMSHRRRDVQVHPEQKWDFISLNDFKSGSCLTGFAYAYLWFSLLISLAVYSVDTFTALQLLIFDRWPGVISPTQLIPFDVSKWVFSICIILSFINLGFEHFRARKIMKRGSVAESFLDSLAVRLESIRMGRGQGYKRFLVFAELTKSKKGAEYITFFTYFSFQSWIRIIICSGPRQIINALTLYSFYSSKLVVNGLNFENSLSTLFDKIRISANGDYRLIVILSGMLFTLVIWVFAVISLLLAAMFFVFFLWHKIPPQDGGLTGFCERKINKRLKQIVAKKIEKAMEEEERERKKAEMKAAKTNGGARPLTMKATLPNLGGDDKLPEMPMLNRNDTTTTLPPYTSRPGTPGSFELDAIDQKRPLPSRSGTMASYSSRAPLVSSAAEMGTSRSESPTPTLPPLYLSGYPPSRTGTSASNKSFGPVPPLQRMGSNGSALNTSYTASPATYSTESMPAFPAPIRSPVGPSNGYRGPGPNQGPARTNTAGGRPTFDEYSNGQPSPHPSQGLSRTNTGGSRPYDDYSAGRSSPGPNFGNPRMNPNGGRPPYDDYSNGLSSPAPSNNPYRNDPSSPRGVGPDGYPIRSATNPMPPRGPQQRFAPQRNMTAPVPQPYHQQADSNGSMRSMGSARPPYHQQTDSNGSMRSAGPPRQPYQQPQQGGGEPDYFNRPNPMAANGPRGNDPRGGYGNNGWNQDTERGNGSRYGAY
ncbi:hypothetical protein B0T24DRAFT_75287 [Lasiosphaeria ovina]|uniref:Pheromone-regulated membrane protein n=1 Tax=Lasiosphaeria ovina TaxID=92902 RepID=A0AAE0NMR8_9PEZI|nr:hypothetical protein B0T24DRAFT_75287 [Lasiosphaeria ovina]